MCAADVADPPPAGDDLSLILSAAFGHPSPDLRQRLHDALDDWLASLQPLHSADEVRNALLACKGTVLEPFALKPIEVELAVLLVRVAFSEAVAAEHLRVVSRETIGVSGGLLLAPDLSSRYVERYAYGQHRDQPEGWHVAPAQRPMGDSHLSWRAGLEARATLVDGAMVVQVDGVNWRSLTGQDEPAADLRSLEAATALPGDYGPIRRLGLDVAARPDHVRIKAVTPEAILRLTVHMQRQSLIEIPFFTKGAQRGSLSLMLRLLPMLDAPERSLPIVATYSPSGGWPLQWMHAAPARSPSIDLADRVAIGQWLVPHRDWVDHLYLDQLL